MTRYTTVAILLHWLIAALIILQIGFGLWIADALHSADQATGFAAFELTQLHKSVGLLVLALSLLRLAWRLAHPAPPPPEGMSRFERWAAGATHAAFYVLLIALPLTGWARVSSSPEFNNVPTVWFGLVVIPHLPVVSSLPAAEAGPLSEGLRMSHQWLAYGAIALLVLHVGAALKHHLWDRDVVLARMTPGLRPRGAAGETPAPRASLGARLAAVALTAAVLVVGVVVVRAGLQEGGGALIPISQSGAVGGGRGGDVQRWTVIAEESEIAFSGTHSGNAFAGRFESWSADIAFDPERLSASRVEVRISVASATTGEALYDGTLRSAAWLDTAAHPEAVFAADSFREGADEGAYVAEGSLTLKGQTQAVALPFTLAIGGEGATMTARLTLDRHAFGVGPQSEAAAGSVSPEIMVDITVAADRAEAGS